MIIMVDAVLMSAISAIGVDMTEWLTQFEDSLTRQGVTNRPIEEMRKSYEREVDTFDLLSLSETMITRTDDRTVMTTSRLLLGDAVAYRSDAAYEGVSIIDDWQFPEAEAKSAHLRLRRGRLPQTALAGLVGEHIARVVAHPFLMHPDMIITRVDHAVDGAVPTVEIGIRQVLVPMEVAA